MVEGFSSLIALWISRGSRRRSRGAHISYLACNGIKLMNYIKCEKAQRYNAMAREECIASLIPLRIITHIVGVTVYLDRDGGFAAIKVEGVGIQPMLTPEFVRARPSSKMLPKQDFRRRHLPPQPTGALDAAH